MWTGWEGWNVLNMIVAPFSDNGEFHNEDSMLRCSMARPDSRHIGKRDIKAMRMVEA